MSSPTPARFLEAFNTLERYIERRYGVPVVVGDVPDPFTGDLDGAEIRIDYDNDPEAALFIVVHLLGHTIQWNRSEEDRKLGSMVAANPTEEQIERLRAYEFEAVRYSLHLLHEAGVIDLDAWVSDFAACDFAYLAHYYRTGEKRPFRSFWKPDQPLIEPLEIPEFTTRCWVSRGSGIVV